MNLLPIAVAFALLVASLGQWGLMHETLRNFGLLTFLGLPGFEVAMLLGLKGHPGHFPLAPFVEFFSNALLYFVVGYIAFSFLRKLRKRWPPSEEIERRVYDNR